MVRSFWAVALVLAFAGCPGGRGELERRTIDVDGASRTYFVYAPPSESIEPRPLVVALHRFAQTGPAMARMTGFNAIAEREGFIVAYPNGKGRAFDAFPEDGDADIEFIPAMIDAIAAEYAVDRSRVYLTGVSNGGTMAYRLACEAPGLFAAVAPVMAALPVETGESCPFDAAPPMLIMHGTADPVIPYDASSIEGPPGRVRPVVPVADAVALFAEGLRCPAEPVVTELDDANPDDGAVTTVESYGPCAGGGEVAAYIIEGGGHTWPGGKERFPRFIVGVQTRDFDASEAIWDFFSRHALAD